MARAMRAYFVATRGQKADPPSGRSAVEKHGGKHYAILRSDHDTLAVYRVRNDGVLKRLKRWPKSLEGR